MENIIVRETTYEIRKITRMFLKNNWGKVFLGMFVFYILMVYVPDIFNLIIPPKTITSQALAEVAENPKDAEITIGGVSSFYNLLLSGALHIGLCSFLINFVRKKEIHPGYLFSGFEYYVKTLLLFILYTIFIMLWSMLLIVPGIIAAISYSQAFYILADDPSKGVMQCIRESKVMMMNNKGKYFGLILSFIGWYILAIIGTVLFEIGIGGIVFSNTTSTILTCITMIPIVFVMTYMESSMAVFYELASGHLVAERPTQPKEEEVPHFITFVDSDSNNDEEK